MLRMMQATEITHRKIRHVRIHYIPEWATARGFKQADIVRKLAPEKGVDKSTVSRWFSGALPNEPHLMALAALFKTDVPSLFRHPDEAWITSLLQKRTEDEQRRIAKIIELTFPRNGTDG